MAALDLAGIYAAVQSHALASGRVARWTGADVMGNPGQGITCACALDSAGPAANRSGLSATAARVALSVRLYQPVSAVDPAPDEQLLGQAVDLLIAAFSGDFDLGASGRWVDLLGAHGAAMAVAWGWARLADALYRVATITLPIIVDDQWDQVA